MSECPFLPFVHGQVVAREAIPPFGVEDFRTAVADAASDGQRLVSLFGVPAGDAAVELFAILARDASGTLCVGSARIGDRYPALTPVCPQAHWFEREIAEQWGVVPQGHPWLKPIRFHAPYRNASAPGAAAAPPPPTPGVTDYHRVEGDEVHEVAVGPVHAGVIEPGHFRFQCHGETVFHLEIELGYQHRGIERRLAGGPDRRTIHYLETAAGDTTIGHATAYSHIVEALDGTKVPADAQVVRGAALELERLANHTGDLGALAADVGFLPTSSFCGRIRGDWLNLTAVLCGSRFGRGLIRPGGLGLPVGERESSAVLAKLDALARDLEGAVSLLWSTNSVTARFEDTGIVDNQTARDLGLVGPAARASGLSRDVRADFPSGVYRYAHIPVSAWHSGDVFARATVRAMECRRSIGFLRDCLAGLVADPASAPASAARPAPNALAVSLVEGWRGEICHVALTGADGAFERYKVTDPSFHNWFGLAMALRNGQISDFPLCNKSFNLSYCGHDL